MRHGDIHLRLVLSGGCAVWPMRYGSVWECAWLMRYGNILECARPMWYGACGNAYELYGNAYERRGYFRGEWALILCGMQDAWGGVIAGGVAVGRIVAMVHCRNGVLTKCRIALPCCCNDALPHRGVVVSRRCCGISQRIGALVRCRVAAMPRFRTSALTRCRNGQCSIGTFSCCRVALPHCRAAVLLRRAALSRCRAAALSRCRVFALPCCRAAASRRCCGVSWRVGALACCRAAALSYSRVAKMTCFCRWPSLVEGLACKHYHAKRNERRRKGLSHG